ncbi:hypothetical protein [Acinetobacter baumannii]|uniref:hypothetical protein n=1 Tax=Acinetobacter baumannii TaxID=470 RepID=UPI002341A694|nr:hypothetical protein [Acinetobacter baumannii]MDC4934155.1 hypothetical protein [Acinetobacter baumannii]
MSLTLDVFDHHLNAFGLGVEEILKDYSESSVILTNNGHSKGLNEIKAFFSSFLESLPEDFWNTFEVLNKEVVGDIAYLVWSAKPYVTLATDTLLVLDGKILAQTFTKF